MPILPTVRPLPYHSASVGGRDAALARALRSEFVPKLERRLPGHHLLGLPHGFIPAFVAKYKQAFPYFVRTDISKFYPNIRHTDLVVGAQIAFRDLLGLDYVPSSFKKRYVGALQRWTNELPLTRGIPLGSALSAVAAPLMLVPIWLEIKRRFQVPLLVWCDDLLIFGRDAQQLADIYTLVENRLALEYDLHLNMEKTVSGRFASTTVEYCGWSFAGGYARITEQKAAAFLERIRQVVTLYKGDDVHPLIKRINHKVDGFGNYYKHGDVATRFEALDVDVRSMVRRWLCLHRGKGRYANNELERLGLRSLSAIKERYDQRRTPRSAVRRTVAPPVPHVGTTRLTSVAEPSRTETLLEKIATQVSLQTAMQRKQLNLLRTLTNYF